MLLHCGNAAEEVAHEGEQGRPAQASQYGERCESAPTHAGNAGNEWHECADEGEESTEEHCQRPPLLDHLFGFFDTFRRHGLDFAGFENTPSEEMADPIVALVADDRSAPYYGQQCHQRQCRFAGRAVGGGEHAGCEQQRVSRQEREEHHTRFHEDDDEDEAQRGGHAHGDPAGYGRARILQQFHKEVNNIHAFPNYSFVRYPDRPAMTVSGKPSTTLSADRTAIPCPYRYLSKSAHSRKHSYKPPRIRIFPGESS